MGDSVDSRPPTRQIQVFVIKVFLGDSVDSRPRR